MINRKGLKFNIAFKMQYLTIMYLKYPFICTVSFVFSKAVFAEKLEWVMKDKKSQFSAMNDIMNDLVTFCNEL